MRKSLLYVKSIYKDLLHVNQIPHPYFIYLLGIHKFVVALEKNMEMNLQPQVPDVVF